MELCTGRPADCAGRIPQEVRCYDLLDALGVEYQRVDHKPADTMAVCEERAAALKTRICKNLFLCNRQETVFYMTANGALAGLVAITAPCAYVSGISALIIGVVAAFLVCNAVPFVENKLKLDDPVGAISVHCVNGLWGM